MLDKRFNHKKLEEKIYKSWEKSGYFSPEQCVKDGIAESDAKMFSMVLPPPNVTGVLHIGHAYEGALQDAFVRYNRMLGKRTLWVPGTDHAAIATQAKVENQIYEDIGKNRHDLGRDKFLEKVEKFALKSQKTILKQLRKIGLSLDWGRLAFTLDKERAGAVFEAFKKMHDAGLIYRKDRVINWDPKGKTTVSDDEIIHKEVKGRLYTFKYDKNFPISIATTRPETKLGDTAVAVHPEDARYQDYVGETFKAEFAGVSLEIKIIADDEINPEFGTGAVGITPAHSMIDWEIADRHNLILKQVINEDAKIMSTGTNLDNKTTLEARKEIISWLKNNDLLEKEEEVDQNISTAERTGAIIEPLPKLQWFVDVNKKFKMGPSKIKGIKKDDEISLKDLMREVVNSGQVKIIPEQFEKRYYHWIDNLRDWCISRQIWYGHRIPAWYHDPVCIPKPGKESEVEKCKEIVISNEEPECIYCNAEYKQDLDTLDTWFSSGLWTFSTLGWPNNTDDLQSYHPTTLMDPGYEILNLWVSRMILFSGFLLGEIPFETVLIHGIVRDKKGRKFSKSSGIGGDPLEVIEEYGADALRMALISGTAVGNDTTFDIEKVRGYKKFVTKIWNVGRFLNMNKPENYKRNEAKILLTKKHENMLNKNQKTKKIFKNHMDNLRPHLASEKAYDFLWNDLANTILEELKTDLRDGAKEKRCSAYFVLETSFLESVKMLHPFVPYVTEEVYKRLGLGEKKFLMIEKW